MDILFYDWRYLGVYLQTPMIPTDIHSHVIGITIPQSTFVSPMRLERITPTLKVWCSNQLSYEDKCGTDRNWTCDTQIFSLVLYRLSYGTNLNQYVKEHFVDTVGIEPNRSDCKSDGLPLTSGP